MALNRYLAVKKETTYGGGATSYAKYYKITSESIEPTIDYELDDDSVASLFHASKVPTSKRAEGSIELYLNPHEVGHLLLALLGSKTTTQPTTGVYQHVFTPSDTLPSLALKVGRDIDAEAISGAAIDSFSIDIDATAGRIPISVDVLAQKAETASHVTPTFTTVRDFTATDVTVTMGATTKKPRTLSLEISNNLSDDHYVLDGSGLLPDIKFSGKREITGTMEIDFSSATDYSAFLSGTESGLTIDILGDTITGSYKYEFKIELPRVYFESVDAEVSGVEPIVASFDFRALKPASGEIITVTLINTEDDYT